MSNDITIVITGRLHPNSLQVLHMYANFANHIIVSCFSKDPFSILASYPFPDHAQVLLVANPEIHDEIRQNVKSLLPYQQPFSDPLFYEHVYLQQAAAPYVHTERVIFVKSDEYYTHWESFVQSMKEHPNKLICVSIGCHKLVPFPYLISKHVIGGKTELLKGTCNGFWNLIKNNRTELITFASNMLYFTPYMPILDSIQLYMYCFFEKLELPYPLSNTFEDRVAHFRNWLWVVPITEMGMYAYNLGTREKPLYVTHENQTSPGHSFENTITCTEDIFSNNKTQEESRFIQAVMACKSFYDDDWFQTLELAEKIGRIDYEPYRHVIEEANHQAHLG